MKKWMLMVLGLTLMAAAPVCAQETETGAPAAPQEPPSVKKDAPPKKKTAAEMVASLPPEDQPEIKKAIEIFGPETQIVPMKADEGHSPRKKSPDPIPDDEAPPPTDEDFAGPEEG